MSTSIFPRCLLLLSLVSANLFAADPDYNSASIPKELLTDAKAIVRNSDITFEIFSPGSGLMKVTKAVTILNKNGLDHSIFLEFYNKFLTVKKIDWTIYDKDGIQVKNFSGAELKDYSAISGYSMYEDNRVKFLDPNYRTTPFTVEFKYEIAFNGLLFMPDWHLYEDFNLAIEKASFRVIVPSTYKLRYLERNIRNRCEIKNEKGKIIYTWNESNQPALREEPFSKSLEEYTQVVYLAPEEFEFAGYKGSQESWESFGKWIYSLSKDRNILPEETKNKVKSLIEGKQTEQEKIEALYSFMQNKVRYVSVQVGIGGWQTIPAESVDKFSYGDCKALSNYMSALLNAAGIKSYYTLVYAGESEAPIISNFPSNQFNHAIVCIPGVPDTTWLECTSQHMPAGYIGTFTDDRMVLLTDENGGKLVRTKKYLIEDNIQDRSARISLSSTGNANASIKTDYKGTLYDDASQVLYLDDTDKKKFLQKNISIKSFDIQSFRHEEKRGKIPVLTENLLLSLPGFATIVGDRMVLNPNLMTKFGPLPYRTKERRSDIRVRRPFIQRDTITIELPLNYKVEQVPERADITSKYGVYSSETTYTAKEIKYIRTFRFLSGEYPAKEYEDFVSFCEKISLSDGKKAVLVKII